jgi:FtsH-binding integral membrane protein
MYNDSYQATYTVADASAEDRAGFIRRTYAHLAGAILAFIGLEVLLFQIGVPELAVKLLAKSQYSWLIVLGAFMGASWVAQSLANSNASTGLQ